MGKYVLAGGHGFGKTAIINELKDRGYKTIPETSRDLIEKLKEKGDVGSLPWVNRKMFQKLICPIRIKDYLDSSEEEIVFFDRGLNDEIGYYLIDDIIPPEEYLSFCKENKYSKIFMPTPSREIFYKEYDSEEAFNRSVKIHELIKKSYLEYGNLIVEVPFGKINEKVNFILKNLD